MTTTYKQDARLAFIGRCLRTFSRPDVTSAEARKAEAQVERIRQAEDGWAAHAVIGAFNRYPDGGERGVIAALREDPALAEYRLAPMMQAQQSESLPF